MPTRNDVARLAKVSSATVSRAFNAPRRVSPDKLARVRRAARTLSYAPDKNASSLRRAGSGTIALLERAADPSPEGDARMYLWLYADMVRSVKAVVDASMYRLNLCSFSKPADIAALKGGVDGIICAHTPSKTELAALQSLGVPFVVFRQGEPPPGPPACSFIDEYQGGSVAGRHLRERGHARPAHITGSLASIEVCQLRWKGFADAFDTEPMLIDGHLGIKGGYDSGARIVPKIRRGEVDCIFVVNDLTCIGVIQALMAGHIRIPRDVSIAGYDNLPFIRTLPLRLTTVDIRYGAAFGGAARMLIDSLGRGGEELRCRVLPRIVPGESSAPRSKAG